MRKPKVKVRLQQWLRGRQGGESVIRSDRKEQNESKSRWSIEEESRRGREGGGRGRRSLFEMTQV